MHFKANSLSLDRSRAVRIPLKNIAGTVVCAGTALSLTLFLRDGATIRLAAPAICIQAVIITALFWGRTSALIGAIIAGFTFALWLYPPYGHLWIHDPGERVMLTVFEIAALCVVFLTPPDPSSTRGKKFGWAWALQTLRFSPKSRPRESAAKNDSLSTVR